MSVDVLLEQFRPALTGHCYRMLGSIVDAEDAVQESMLRAWTGMEKFREQSSLKTSSPSASTAAPRWTPR
ncbi:MAG TPA: sigma factor [Gemmatimonadaceae bacterium]|nr:sigma factor [Gemmatimonadaceae bacterium]